MMAPVLAANVCPWCGAPGPVTPPLTCGYCGYRFSLEEARAALADGLPAFAAQPVEQVTERLRAHVGDCPYVLFDPTIPARKLRNVREVHAAHLPEHEPIAAIFDHTAFGSAKDGVVVTPNRLCFKEMFRPPRMLPWRSLEPEQLRELDGRNLELLGARLYTGGQRGLAPKVLRFVLEMAHAAHLGAGADRPQDFHAARDFVFVWGDDAVLSTLRRHVGFGSDYVHYAPSIPQRMLQSVRRTYGDALAPDERVLLLADATVMGSGVNGVVVTARAIYRNGIGQTPARMAWRDLEPNQVKLDGKRLLLGEVLLDEPSAVIPKLACAVEELLPLHANALAAARRERS